MHLSELNPPNLNVASSPSRSTVYQSSVEWLKARLKESYIIKNYIYIYIYNILFCVFKTIHRLIPDLVTEGWALWLHPPQ